MRNRIKWTAAVAWALVWAVASFLGTASGAQHKHPADRHLTPMQAAEIVVEGKERPFLLDVRFSWEYSDYHIPGTVNIPVQNLDKPENLAKLPKNRKIILYCRTGARADRALSILLPKGYMAYSIDGGIAAWWRDIIEPPSIDSSPFGDTAALYRKRQALRNYFMSIPGAGPAPAPRVPASKLPTPTPKAKQPCQVPSPPAEGRPPLENPCG